MSQNASIQVVTITPQELMAMLAKVVKAELDAREPEPPPSTAPLTMAEVAKLARRGVDKVKSAAMTGALPVAALNPEAKGRAPRWLFDREAVAVWMRAGCPLRPD